jgi:menaquinone-dependent protoporphyrinogen oxidase
VGGELIFEKMNFIERWMTRKITGIEMTTSQINYEAVDKLIADLKELSC